MNKGQLPKTQDGKKIRPGMMVWYNSGIAHDPIGLRVDGVMLKDGLLLVQTARISDIWCLSPCEGHYFFSTHDAAKDAHQHDRAVLKASFGPLTPPVDPPRPAHRIDVA